MTRWAAACVSVALVCASACGGDAESNGAAGEADSNATPAAAPDGAASQAPGASPEALLAEGQALYQTRCATCHGDDGSGTGPGAAALTPKPRDFASSEWQSSVTDEKIRQVISYGGAAVGLSPMMPPQPDLAGQPRKLEALVAYVRQFGKSDG